MSPPGLGSGGKILQHKPVILCFLSFLVNCFLWHVQFRRRRQESVKCESNEIKFYVVKWFGKVLSGALCFWPTITWYEFYRWLAYFCHSEQRAWLQFLIGFKADIDESGLWKRGIQLTLLQENIRAILLQGSNELRLSFSATKANVILKIFYLRIFILPPRHNFLKTM